MRIFQEIQLGLIESDIINKLDKLTQFISWVSSGYNIHINYSLFCFMVGAEDTDALQFPLLVTLPHSWYQPTNFLFYRINVIPVPSTCCILDFSR